MTKICPVTLSAGPTTTTPDTGCGAWVARRAVTEGGAPRGAERSEGTVRAAYRCGRQSGRSVADSAWCARRGRRGRRHHGLSWPAKTADGLTEAAFRAEKADAADLPDRTTASARPAGRDRHHRTVFLLRTWPRSDRRGRYPHCGTRRKPAPWGPLRRSRRSNDYRDSTAVTPTPHGKRSTRQSLRTDRRCSEGSRRTATWTPSSPARHDPAAALPETGCMPRR